MTTLDKATRERVRALIATSSGRQVQDELEERKHVNPAQQVHLLLDWGSVSSVGEDEWIQTYDPTHPAGADGVGQEMGEVSTGRRLVTLSIKAESFLSGHRADWYLDELRSVMKSRTFREALYGIGFGIVRFERTARLSVQADQRYRSVAVMDVRLGYVAAVEDATRSTYIERATFEVSVDNGP